MIRLNAIRPPAVYTSDARLTIIPPKENPRMRTAVLSFAAVVALAPAVLAADKDSDQETRKWPPRSISR